MRTNDNEVYIPSHAVFGYAVVTCEIKLFQNYFTGLLQLMNIVQHVQVSLK